ncbi:MFS transporter [Nocardia sp. NPDC059240]|uniref:MFS transporter n=1 Tax=Nocardia sp. NPDC059240 TaxID=3346786 RepID=UPI0036B6D81A
MTNIPINARVATGESADSSKGLGRTVILAAGTFAVGTDAFILAGFLPELAGALRVSTATAGLAVTVFAATYALGSPVLATLTARLPRRALLVSALLVLGLANLGSALAPTFSILLITRILAAIGASAFTPNAGAVAAAMVRPEMRARALAVVIAGLTVATALGVPMGDAIGQWLGWRSALAGVAGLCLLAAIGVAVRVPALPGSPYVPLHTRLSVLRNPSVATVLPLTVLGMTAAYVVYAYAVPAFGALGISASSTAWMLASYGTGAIVGSLYSGYATDRWGTTRVLTVGCLTLAAALGVLGVLAAAHWTVPALVALLAAAWGASSFGQSPAQQHRLIAAAPQESGLVVALNASCIYLGIGAGSLLGGVMIGHGVAAMFALAAALAVVALGYLRLTTSVAR